MHPGGTDINHETPLELEKGQLSKLPAVISARICKDALYKGKV